MAKIEYICDVVYCSYLFCPYRQRLATVELFTAFLHTVSARNPLDMFIRSIHPKAMHTNALCLQQKAWTKNTMLHLSTICLPFPTAKLNDALLFGGAGVIKSKGYCVFLAKMMPYHVPRKSQRQNIQLHSYCCMLNASFQFYCFYFDAQKNCLFYTPGICVRKLCRS